MVSVRKFRSIRSSAPIKEKPESSTPISTMTKRRRNAEITENLPKWRRNATRVQDTAEISMKASADFTNLHLLVEVAVQMAEENRAQEENKGENVKGNSLTSTSLNGSEGPRKKQAQEEERDHVSHSSLNGSEGPRNKQAQGGERDHVSHSSLNGSEGPGKKQAEGGTKDHIVSHSSLNGSQGRRRKKPAQSRERLDHVAVCPPSSLNDSEGPGKKQAEGGERDCVSHSTLNGLERPGKEQAEEGKTDHVSHSSLTGSEGPGKKQAEGEERDHVSQSTLNGSKGPRTKKPAQSQGGRRDHVAVPPPSRLNVSEDPRRKKQAQDIRSGSVRVSDTIKLEFLGITFYKRIGRWTTHMWSKKQIYIGSFPTATEAARAYDKASLKYYKAAAQLNYNCKDYFEDIAEMVRLSNDEYIDLLRQRAKASKPDNVEEGVTRCPEGWFEVKIKETTPPKNWRFLGRFDNLEDARRCYQEWKKQEASSSGEKS